jgi:alpha-galactosidase
MDELRAAHPGLEIESCAGGGGRIDLGVIEHTDRVWASDCIDPLERQQIVRYTQLLLPPELIGTHIGSEQSHTTLRHHDLSFRGATALWGHMGIEWDLAVLSDIELEQLGQWVAFHKADQGCCTAASVNADHPDTAIWVSGVVARNQQALYGVTQSAGRDLAARSGAAAGTGLPYVPSAGQASSKSALTRAPTCLGQRPAESPSPAVCSVPPESRSSPSIPSTATCSG